MATDPYQTHVHKQWLKDNAGYDVKLTRHGREEMRNDDVTLLQIRHVIEHGVVTEVALDIRSGKEKIRLEGNDQNGRHLAVVINRLEDGNVKLITTFVR